MNPSALEEPIVVVDLPKIGGGDIEFSDRVIGGTFTLSYQGQTTASLSYAASASAVKSALESLGAIGAGNVNVNQYSPFMRTWNVEFVGSLASTNVPLLVADGSQLIGNSVGVGISVRTLKQGGHGVNEQQEIRLGPRGLGLETKTWWPDTLYYTDSLFVNNLRPECLTNGPVTVPAKTIFYCTQVMRGPHWMGYDDTLEPKAWGSKVMQPKADPSHFWFYPRTDTRLLGSRQYAEEYETTVQSYYRLPGAIFRRIGAADKIQKCVPVIMVSARFVDDL